MQNATTRHSHSAPRTRILHDGPKNSALSPMLFLGVSGSSRIWLETSRGGLWVWWRRFLLLLGCCRSSTGTRASRRLSVLLAHWTFFSCTARSGWAHGPLGGAPAPARVGMLRRCHARHSAGARLPGTWPALPRRIWRICLGARGPDRGTVESNGRECSAHADVLLLLSVRQRSFPSA